MIATKVFFLIFVIFLIAIEPTSGWRTFWKGRKFDGNVGHPTEFHGSLKSPADEDLWFVQKLDHFDPTNQQTWRQRYFVNDEFFKTNGPVFLMIGGEGEASAKWMKKGAWIHYAKQFGALCFQLEHRFYGKSHPTEDLSTENLRFLSSEQALADLAYFITSINQLYNLTNDNRWIAFGGSYPGSLAAWLREKYSHLVHGSISTSGPLLAKIDFFEYYEVVADSLSTYEQCDCVSVVQKAFQQIEILMKHMIGQRSLNEKYQLCDPIEKSIENALDVANFYEGLASYFAETVQYNKDNRDSSHISIDDVCDILCNKTIGPPVTRLATVNQMILKDNNQICFDYKYDKMIAIVKNISWDSEAANGGRQWTYQTCTEFGFYQTSSNSSSIFGDKFPEEFFIRQCADIYGEKLNGNALQNGVDRTNIIYGGLKPAATNVLYVHGSIDPWHALGITKTNKNQPEPTIYILGTAHCANMYEPNAEKDLPQLKAAREAIAKFIGALLQ